MADILTRIVARKREELVEAAARLPETELRARAEAAAKIPQKPGRPGFRERLSVPGPGGVNIIAEIKRASPSKGDIQPNLDPAATARSYDAGGAACLSVLTDRDFFKARPEDFAAARLAVDLPLLRKDFTIAPYQIHEAALMGADAVLLIVRILEPSELKDLRLLAESLGLDALVEAHSAAEIETALRSGARLVGINNRNLASFETDVSLSAHLAGTVDEECVLVAESGIRSREDIVALNRAGIFNFLVGESIVRSPDPAAFLRHLRGVEAAS